MALACPHIPEVRTELRSNQRHCQGHLAVCSVSPGRGTVRATCPQTSCPREDTPSGLPAHELRVPRQRHCQGYLVMCSVFPDSIVGISWQSAMQAWVLPNFTT